jgi:hypothetical protein
MNPLTNLITNLGTGFGFRSNPQPQSQPQNFNNMNDHFGNMNLSGQAQPGGYNPNVSNNYQNNPNPYQNPNNNTYANINRFSNQK